MHTLSRKLFITAACILAAALVFTLAIQRLCKRDIQFDPVPLHESNGILKLPYCGFYHLYGYTLSEKETRDAEEWCRSMLANDSQSIVLLEINLRNYASRDISRRALEQLETVLSSFSGANKQIILRFLYDWDGNALQTEPGSRRRIKKHMEQTAPVVNRFSSHVFLMQGVFTGNCGEMNQTHYGGNDDITDLMATLSKAISPEIFLSVRTPQHLRTIVGSGSPLSQTQAYRGTLISRLGLYNDGILGNVFDCGTYDDTPRSGSPDYTEKGTREEEIAFQNTLCLYVPNGGEGVLDNPFNDLTAAIADLSQMHVSYLSCDHDAAVLDKWKASVYKPADPNIFEGMSGYDYIAAHLGYRYVVRQLEIEPSDAATFRLSIENTGFSPAYRPFETTLLLQENTSGQQITIPVSLDTRTLLPNEIYHITAAIPSIGTGSYSVTLSMRDPATGCSIPFANNGAETGDGLACGQLNIS